MPGRGGGGAVSILHGDRDTGLGLALVVRDSDGYRAVLVKGKIVRQGDGMIYARPVQSRKEMIKSTG